MQISKKILMGTALLASFSALTPAMAAFKPSVTPLSVYPGCEAPKAVTGAKTYYVDPVKGLDTNDGSQAKPWKTLSTVLNTRVVRKAYARPYSRTAPLLSVNPNGQVRAGDTILLMNGNYGHVIVNGVNDNFITIKAAPGQKPLLSQLTVNGANRWILQGLKVQGQRNSVNSLVNISHHGHMGPAFNIIFDGNSMSSADDTSAWTPADYETKAAYGGLKSSNQIGGGPDSGCLAFTNNTFEDLRSGAAIYVDRTLFAGNTINRIGGSDGINLAASDVIISQNFLTNFIARTTLAHIDAIQGQTADSGKRVHFKNVIIDRNLVMRQSTPGLKTEIATQGISAFDSNWTNLTVTNNIVLTGTYHGITWGAVTNGLFANNTVLNDGIDKFLSTGIRVNHGKTTYCGSRDVNIVNNVASTMSLDMTVPNMRLANNVTEFLSLRRSATLVDRFTKPGIYEGNTRVVTGLNANFVKFDPANVSYDLSLKPGSVLANVGVSSGVPASDFTGRARIAPFDVGAYELLPTTSQLPDPTTSALPTPTVSNLPSPYNTVTGRF